ncbi:MAG: bifunctional UDP-N-acetylglucosamine diphosphorylase/glucosamine-1-phosphate N-acetyltransferase GlmU [Campylobacteraceae bacterium]|jgi:bifunctional UDP-N-acetylglucosamine pyrophosphorylase/glucosamine-1-phosphate N-acetyltransferase|nr:bifunctional UDP-N-acetylglucosamine diphosphorylase/glucosamine-1-phosphate N-acetyltransferase GlmU [Campylobacteraceae bacterium]
MRPSIAIMAAGLGTRMKSSTPKVLHKLCGYTMLHHILKEAQSLSDDIHVVLFHHSEDIKAELLKKFAGLHIVIQNHERFPGTGGAIMGLKPKYNRMLVLSGDMPLLQMEDMKLLCQDENADIVMGAFYTNKPKGYGRVLADEELHVSEIVEEKDADEEQKKVNLVNAGVYSFNTHFLNKMLPKLNNDNAQKEYYITDLIKLANEHGNSVKAVLVEENAFMGINSKAQLAAAESIMQNRIKHTLMKEGVIMRLPETIYIEAGVTFEGENTLENGVTLLGKTHIQNSLIKSHTRIESSTIIDSSVGPFAHVRPYSLIKNSHVGNFVEIKKSTLTGVKAGHLSYLGDAVVDEGTNVGCGTITCNYDGKEKHQTIIGKNVFIGSDTQFIAPVTISDNVVIAAGTTVTKDVPEGALAINRAPLKFIKDFFYKYFGK